jgi:hypothetical protein
MLNRGDLVRHFNVRSLEGEQFSYSAILMPLGENTTSQSRSSGVLNQRLAMSGVSKTCMSSP